MINGTIRGEIVSRADWRRDQDAKLYCGCLVVAVSGWVDGQQKRVEYPVYLPKFMERRVDFFFKDTTKWCTVVFEDMQIVESNASPGTFKIALRANRIES